MLKKRVSKPERISQVKKITEATHWVLERRRVHPDVINFLIIPYVRSNAFRRLNGIRLLYHSTFTIHAAANVNKSVIVHRNGMTRDNNMLVYDGALKTVIPGQWLRGKKVLSADLSPNGEYFLFGLKFNNSRSFMTVLSKPPYFSGLCCFSENPYYGETRVGGAWIKDGLMILNSHESVLPVPCKGAIPDGIEQELPKQYETLFKQEHTDMYDDLYNHELKDLLAKRHLKVSGNHAELVNRLVQDDYDKDLKKPKYDNQIPNYLASKRHPRSSTRTLAFSPLAPKFLVGTVVTIRMGDPEKVANGNTYLICEDGYLWINHVKMLDLTDHLKFKEMKANY